MLKIMGTMVIILVIGLGAVSSDARQHRYQQGAVPCQTYGICYGQAQVNEPARRVISKKRVQVSKHAKKKRYASRKKQKTKTAMQWNMVKVKTVQGFYLTVHPAYAHKFLRFFEILAQNNVKVPKEIVGCYSPGHKPGSNHRIGAACDIQWGWNKTIPEMYHAGKWIKEAGLYDGCSFRDCGHVEAIRGLYNKSPNLYASMEKFKVMQATANYQP